MDAGSKEVKDASNCGVPVNCPDNDIGNDVPHHGSD